jgi:hypothetical protein
MRFLYLKKMHIMKKIFAILRKFGQFKCKSKEMEPHLIKKSQDDFIKLKGFASSKIGALSHFIAQQTENPITEFEMYQASINQVFKFFDANESNLQFTEYDRNFMLEVASFPFLSAIYLRTFEIVPNVYDYPKRMKLHYEKLDFQIDLLNNVILLDSKEHVDNFQIKFVDKLLETLYTLSNPKKQD